MVKADADLWNDRMLLQIDHRGGIVNSGFMKPDLSAYAQWERIFYVRDNESGELWAVPRCATGSFAGAFRFSAGRSGSFRREADALRDRINELAWDGDWYVRGFTGAGRAFGSRNDDEGRIFLRLRRPRIFCAVLKILADCAMLLISCAPVRGRNASFLSCHENCLRR